jgi:small subunit ribosomal protein S10
MFNDMPLSHTQKAHLEELTADCETQEELDQLLASPELQYLLALQELKDLADTPEPILSSLPLPGKAMYQPLHHKPQWRIPVATITFQGYFPERLMLFTHFAVHAASALGIPTSKVYALPKQRRLWTVPKSPFVHKRSQENFERITHSRGIKAWDADPLTIDMWTYLLGSYAMAGVGMRVVRWSRMEVGGGGTELKKVHQVLDDVLKRTDANMRDGDKVRRLGEQIVEKELAVAQQAEREEIMDASEA